MNIEEKNIRLQSSEEQCSEQQNSEQQSSEQQNIAAGVQTDPRWRWKAKQVLYNYSSSKRLLRDSTEEILYGQGPYTDRRWRHGGISDPTAARALMLDNPRRQRLAREVAAVDKLVAVLRQDGRRHRLRCLQLLELVYLRHSHSLYYAAVELDCSERTCKRMNSALLAWLAHELGWLNEHDAARLIPKLKERQEQ